jgi:antitoxin ParD1/3/4
MAAAEKTSVEKISIALPGAMAAIIRSAVDSGEYASNSEVVRDAMRGWTYQRSLQQQGIGELRQVWREALQNHSPSIAPEEVLDRLEQKYQAIAAATKLQK